MTEREDRGGQQQAAQREKIFWLPKRRLRKIDKDRVKQILGERDGLKCAICGKPESVGNLELDHVNENPSNNHLENLRLAHHSCNSSLYNLKRASIPLSGQHVREKISSVGSEGAVWSSREGEKHDVMRVRWENWVPSVLEAGGVMRARDLAERAPRALGIGSSVTYRRYLNEDVAGGVFERYREDGVLWVRYLGGGKPVE